MGVYLMEVEIVDENMWLMIIFFYLIVNIGILFFKSIICKKDNFCDIIKVLFIYIFQLVVFIGLIFVKVLLVNWIIFEKL